MAETLVEYGSLPKENFMAATWLGTKKAKRGLASVDPRWRGYCVDLSHRGVTTLYPLRASHFGTILPHIYAKRMRHDERPPRRSPLADLHAAVSMAYEINGKYDHDYATNNFRRLIDELDRLPYNKTPELAANLREVFAGYQDSREAQRIKVARGLSRTINQHELYVVAVDATEESTPDDSRNLYAARLSGIVNLRQGAHMHYELVVSDSYGEHGFLPPSFEVAAGVSAPAASH